MKEKNKYIKKDKWGFTSVSDIDYVYEFKKRTRYKF